jgi:hypothetical protein
LAATWCSPTRSGKQHHCNSWHNNLCMRHAGLCARQLWDGACTMCQTAVTVHMCVCKLAVVPTRQRVCSRTSGLLQPSWTACLDTRSRAKAISMVCLLLQLCLRAFTSARFSSDVPPCTAATTSTHTGAQGSMSCTTSPVTPWPSTTKRLVHLCWGGTVGCPDQKGECCRGCEPGFVHQMSTHYHR